MKYNTSDIYERKVLFENLRKLIKSGCIVELKQVRKRRSIDQNSYLHVCITLYAIHFGYTIDEAKTLLKRLCNFMVYEKNGQKFLKRTRDLDTKEMTTFIDFIRTHASIEGCHIPTSDQYLTEKYFFDNEIEKNANML